MKKNDGRGTKHFKLSHVIKKNTGKKKDDIFNFHTWRKTAGEERRQFNFYKLRKKIRERKTAGKERQQFQFSHVKKNGVRGKKTI